MERSGFDAESIDAAVAEEAASIAFEIYDDCAEAVGAFTALGSQWRVIAIPFGGVIWQGIDYGAIPAVFDVFAVPQEDRAGLFNDLRVMEQAALAVLNAKKSDDE